VFREGAETVLFINALATTEGGWSASLFAGLGAATAGLVVLFYFINLIAQKIPLRPLFIITSAFLFAMAIKFIGEAVQEFQEQAMIPVTEVKGSPFFSAIGLNPSVEALSIQFLVILFALATYSVVRRNSRLTRQDKDAHGEAVNPTGRIP
jgi:high-affinity iron transporter